MAKPLYDIGRLFRDLGMHPAKMAEALGHDRTVGYRWVRTGRMGAEAIANLLDWAKQQGVAVDLTNYRLS